MPTLTSIRPSAVSSGRPAPGELQEIVTPHLALVRAPVRARAARGLRGPFLVATYNVHRWSGLNGHRRPDPTPVFGVIGELGADLIRAAGGSCVRARATILWPRSAISSACTSPLRLPGCIGGDRSGTRSCPAGLWRPCRFSISPSDASSAARRWPYAWTTGEHSLDVVSTHLALSDRMRPPSGGGAPGGTRDCASDRR